MKPPLTNWRTAEDPAHESVYICPNCGQVGRENSLYKPCKNHIPKLVVVVTGFDLRADPDILAEKGFCVGIPKRKLVTNEEWCEKTATHPNWEVVRENDRVAIALK